MAARFKSERPACAVAPAPAGAGGAAEDRSRGVGHPSRSADPDAPDRKRAT